MYTPATIEATTREIEGGDEHEEGSSYLMCVVDKEQEVETVGREGFEVKVGGRGCPW
jgi:hypothetical protein